MVVAHYMYSMCGSRGIGADAGAGCGSGAGCGGVRGRISDCTVGGGVALYALPKCAWMHVVNNDSTVGREEKLQGLRLKDLEQELHLGGGGGGGTLWLGV